MTRPLVPRLPRQWRPRPILPLLTLAVVVLGIATSAGVGMRTSSRGGGSSAAPVVPVAAITGASHSVQIVNFAYAPQAITVTAGDSITWTNQDEAPHTVTTSSGPQAINSPNLSKGQSFTYTFTVPGTYNYYCAVHPDMRAQVVVKPAAAPPSTSSAAAKPTSAAPPPSTHSSAASSTHSAAPSSAHSGMAPSSSSMAMPSSAPSSAPASSAEPSSSSLAAAPAPVASSSSAATDAAAPAAAAGNNSQSRLNPTLVLAGLTAAATVFCLLLLASRRPEAESKEDGP